MNVEKVIEDQLVKADADAEERPEDLRHRISRKLQDIMDARLSKEVKCEESKAVAEGSQLEASKTLLDNEVFADAELIRLYEPSHEDEERKSVSLSQPMPSQPLLSQSMRPSLRKNTPVKNKPSSKVRFSHIKMQTIDKQGNFVGPEERKSFSEQ